MNVFKQTFQVFIFGQFIPTWYTSKNQEHSTFYSGSFSIGNIFFQIQFPDKFLKFEVMKYLIHCVSNRSNLTYWFIFNSKTQDLTFLNSSVESKLGFLSVSLRHYFQDFPDSQRDFGILNVALAGLLNFSQFRKKRCKFAFFNTSLGCTSKLLPIH